MTVFGGKAMTVTRLELHGTPIGRASGSIYCRDGRIRKGISHLQIMKLKFTLHMKGALYCTFTELYCTAESTNCTWRTVRTVCDHKREMNLLIGNGMN